LIEYGTVKYRPAIGPKTVLKKRYTQSSRYAILNEGWVTIKHTGGVTGKPFFRPAIDQGNKYIQKLYGLEMKDQISKMAKRMNKEYKTLSKTFKKKLAS
jgi:hypothetical protein